MECHWLAEVPYKEALTKQIEIRDAVLAGKHPGALLLLTHPPTYTLGRNATNANVLSVPKGAELHRTRRGGDVTFHGPGQLVGYPIVNLQDRKLGVRDFVCLLYRTLAEVVSTWGIEANWDDKAPGLWVGTDKLAAFGINVHRQVTTHGFALNVNTNLDWYRHIIACGLTHRGVTSLERLLDHPPTMEDVVGVVRQLLMAVLSLDRDGLEYNRGGAVDRVCKKETI